MLAEKGLVEGEYPDIFISEVISQKTGQLDSYVKSRGLKRQYYKDLVVAFLEKKKEGATRSEIDRLLLDLIPKSSKSPAVYIGRLLNEMKEKDNVIHFDHSYWCLNERK